MTKPTTLDGNWRIRCGNPPHRRTVYVRVFDGQIVDIQPELPKWLDQSFKEFCQSFRQRYPKTFERQEWTKQLVDPTLDGASDLGGQDPRPNDPTPEQIAERCAVIRKGRAVQNHNEKEQPPYEHVVVSTAALPGVVLPEQEPLYFMDE